MKMRRIAYLAFAGTLACSEVRADTEKSRSLRTSVAELVQANPETFRFALHLPEGFRAGAVVAAREGTRKVRVLFGLPESLVPTDAQPARSVFLAETLQFDGSSRLAKNLFEQPFDPSMGGSVMLTLLGVREIRAPLADPPAVAGEVLRRLRDSADGVELEPDQAPAVVTRVWEGLIKIQVRTRTLLAEAPRLTLDGFASETVVMPGPETVVTYMARAPIPIAYELTPIYLPLGTDAARAIRPRFGARARGAGDSSAALPPDVQRAPSSIDVPRVAPQMSDGPILGPALAPPAAETHSFAPALPSSPTAESTDLPTDRAGGFPPSDTPGNGSSWTAAEPPGMPPVADMTSTGPATAGVAAAWESAAVSQGTTPIDARSGREVGLFYATNRAPPTGRDQTVWTLVELLIAPWHQYLVVTAVLYAVLLGMMIAHGISGAMGARTVYRWMLAPMMFCAGAIVLVGYLGRDSRVTDSALLFGNEIGDLRYGICKVQIPESYRQGPGEPDEALIRLATWHRAHQPRIVGPPTNVERAQWSVKVNEALRASSSKSVLVFVHGYNNTFDEAAASAALLKCNLGFAGPVMFFSWPSQGMTCAYSIDSTVAENASPALQQLLQEISRDLDADEIHIVAHSMGNRLTARALAAIGSDPLTSPPLHRFGECILAAADIDATTFSASLAARIPPIVRRVTLYKSSNDLALKMSKLFNGFPRVGDGGADLVVYPGMDSIDASGIDTSSNSHGYIISNPVVLADVANVLAAAPREQRRLRDRTKNSMPYWELVP